MSEIQQLKDRIRKQKFEGLSMKIIREDYEPAGDMMMNGLVDNGEFIIRFAMTGIRSGHYRIFATEYKPTESEACFKPHKAKIMNIDTIKTKPVKPIGKSNTLIGCGCSSKFSNCVVIGSNIESTEDFQLIVGNSKIQATRKLTEDEYKTIRDTMRIIAGLSNVAERDRHSTV